MFRNIAKARVLRINDWSRALTTLRFGGGRHEFFFAYYLGELNQFSLGTVDINPSHHSQLQGLHRHFLASGTFLRPLLKLFRVLVRSACLSFCAESIARSKEQHLAATDSYAPERKRIFTTIRTQHNTFIYLLIYLQQTRENESKQRVERTYKTRNEMNTKRLISGGCLPNVDNHLVDRFVMYMYVYISYLYTFVDVCVWSYHCRSLYMYLCLCVCGLFNYDGTSCGELTHT